jgi:hypothetical protein
METFSRCISTIPDHTEIHFSGYSEPFLNSGCAEMIEHASVHHKVRIFTTLVGSKEDDIKDLSKNPRLSFSIHFPSYPPQENITISERYIKCLKYLLNGKTSVSLHFRGGVLHPSLKELGLNAQQGVLHDRAGNVALNANHKKSPDRNFTNSCDVYCLRLRRNVLLPNGDVSLCCMDYGLKHVLGNLRRDSYQDLFYTSKYAKIIEGSRDSDADVLCNKCHHWIPFFSTNQSRCRFYASEAWLTISDKCRQQFYTQNFGKKIKRLTRKRTDKKM